MGSSRAGENEEKHEQAKWQVLGVQVIAQPAGTEETAVFEALWNCGKHEHSPTGVAEDVPPHSLAATGPLASRLCTWAERK